MTEVPNMPIPSWFETPPLSQVNPPARTRLQKLPFGELSWEDFERLCLRLARLETNVEHCQLYGVKGQEQEGIDLFARKKMTDKYTVYQCKREENFGPSKIRKAVQKFLEGSWAQKAEAFVLCTQESLAPKKRAEELENQRELLRERNVDLVAWDSHQLSIKLKNLPDLVDDFFGRAWVNDFCGKERAKELGARLDAEKLREFREKCASFYKHVFDKHDPGLPIYSPNESISVPFEKRYIIPDVYEWRSTPIIYPSEGSEPTIVEDEFRKRVPEERTSGPGPGIDRSERAPIAYRARQAIENWLTTSNRTVVIGGPGSGKSSLLRFICLDLLSGSPRMAFLARKWGQFFPIWLPFALWTKIISNESTSSCSLRELLFSWLKSWDEERLCPLFEQALDDERLLLLVDGVDEYTNELAAQVASDRLKVFLEQRNAPAIITSRPHGLKFFGMQDPEWKLAELSDFSPDQQKQLSRIWFTAKIRNLYDASKIDDEEIERRADVETGSFVVELNTSSDLQELAKVPLLLCLMIYHSFHNVQLPQSRFKAYDSLIEHLISTHPRRRRTAAFLTDAGAELSDDDIKKILARLAYHIHKKFGEGLIDLIQAERIIDEYLKDSNSGFGFGQREARRYSREIVSVSEKTLGLIVRKSAKEIGFYHRVFQEYLAAYHLSSLPLTYQLEIVTSFCANPRWREVILGVLHFTNRAEDIQLFVDKIRAKQDPSNPLNQCNLNLLLSEIAFSDFNCAPNLAKEIAGDVFSQVELSSWMPHRQRLLQQVLNGLRSTKVRELVKSNLTRWFPCRARFRDGIFNAMAKWPMNEEVINCLFKGLHDEEEWNQFAAAEALAHLARGDHGVFEMLYSLVRSAVSPKTTVAAIKALLLGWSDSENLKRIIEAARDSSSPDVRYLSILGRIKMKTQTEEDRRELIQLSPFGSRLSFSWHHEIATSLMTGWPKSDQTKEACLEAVERHLQKRDMDPEIAWRVLLEGYPQDPDVARYCTDEIKYEEHPFLFLHFDAWRMLGQNFQDHVEIVKSIDEWLPKQEHREREISFAALVGRTSIAKNKLLSLIGSHLPFRPVDSLLKGWGMKDPEVSEKLLEFASGPAGEVSQIGRYLPQIIEDEARCRKRLLELLQDPNCKRPEFVLDGLRILGDTKGDTETVDLALKIIARVDSDSWIYENVTKQLIMNYSSDSRVKKLAKKQLTEGKGNFGAIASAYGDDKEIRRRIIEMACPLPSQLRSVIAERLGDQTTDSSFAMSLLRLYDHEVDEEVKTQASINYHNWLKVARSNVEQQNEALSKSIVCYGPDYEERRRAAFCGLVTLDRLDIMEKAQESIGEERLCSISLHSGLRLNTILIRHILENWKIIKKSFGEDLWVRLSKFSSPNKVSIWEKLSIFADEFTAPRDDLLHFLEDNKERTVPPNLLRFLGRIRPKTSLLLDYCLKTMLSEGSRRTSEEIDELVAGQLLGVHFGGDDDVLAAILSYTSMKAFYRYDPIIVALCEGWPTSDELKKIAAEIQERKPMLAYPAYFRLICQIAPSTFVFDALIKKLPTPGNYYRHHLHRNIRSFLGRIQRDDTLLEMLKNCLQDNPTPSEKATIPRLIFSARGSLSEIRTWCIEEMAKQLNDREFPEIGFDLFNDEPRQVLHSLLDVLDQHGYVESYSRLSA